LVWAPSLSIRESVPSGRCEYIETMWLASRRSDASLYLSRIR
jgi:hypothetical protein